jgi:hypothetical protein
MWSAARQPTIHASGWTAVARRGTGEGSGPEARGGNLNEGYRIARAAQGERSATSHVRTATIDASNPLSEAGMTATNKTPLEHVNDTLAQLKEMRHYAKNNVENLTAQWLLFDGELKKFKQAERVENLMARQSEFHDAVEEEISALEEIAAQLQPASEQGEGTPSTQH